jgi:hypothetical protein
MNRGPGYEALWNYFGLSYAGWLTLPRALMHEMPDEWQGRMAVLLEEWHDTWANPPDVRISVCNKRGNKFAPLPEVLCNYRRPDRAAIAKMKGTP